MVAKIVLQNRPRQICYTIPAETPAMKRTLNTTINRSKNEKNDEHYTQLSDIEDEVRHYRSQFADKTVLCNCDDPRNSNFFKYFTMYEQ